MATTSPDNIWTPDSGDDYALTVDLAATADTVQDALMAVRAEMNAQPLIQHGTLTFSGNGSSAITVSQTFTTPYASPPTVIPAQENTTSGNVLGVSVTSVSTTGFSARMISTSPSSGPGFGGTYTVGWIAVGDRP